MEQLYMTKKLIENLQGQRATSNHPVVTESLKEELNYLTHENLTKTHIRKTITENQYLPSTLATKKLVKC